MTTGDPELRNDFLPLTGTTECYGLHLESLFDSEDGEDQSTTPAGEEEEGSQDDGSTQVVAVWTIPEGGRSRNSKRRVRIADKCSRRWRGRGSKAARYAAAAEKNSKRKKRGVQ